MHYFSKRISQLWRAGIVERVTPSFSRYVYGSRSFVYFVGSGKASAAARTGLRPDTILDDRWRAVLAEAAPARARARDALLAIGIDATEIDHVLHNNTVAALRFIAGETSGVQHHALAAQVLSTLWFRARIDGFDIEDIRPDGVADLSFRESDVHRYRELVTDGRVVIKPDCLFTIAGQQYALEAETGSSSTAKLRMKLRRYARAFERRGDLRLIIACATSAHARRARDIITSLDAEPLCRATEVRVFERSV
jgi:hypothetical protein